MLHHIEQMVDEDDVLQDASEAQATLRTAIGNVYAGLGIYEPDADRHLGKALEIRRGLYSESHPKVAESLYNLAKATRWKQGSKSKDLYLQALAIQRTQLGETHVDTIATVEAIANLRLDSGDYDGARDMFQQVLKAKRAAYGEDHPEVAGTLSNLASLYADSENLDQAKPLYERALAIQRKHFAGRPHLKLADSLFGMGGCAMLAGECREAEIYLRECAAMVQQLLGDETPWSGHIASQLGSCLLRQGQCEEARRCFQRAIDIYTGKDGNARSRGLRLRTQGARRRLADCLTQMGRYEEAEAQLIEARNIASEWNRQPWHRRHRAMVSRSLAGLYEAWGKPDEAAESLGRAEAQFREVLERFRAQDGGGGFAAAICRSDLGECLAKLGRFAEAERELLEARRFMTSVCRKHQCVQDAMERLAVLYDAWNKPDKAAEYRTLLAENKRL
jgi:tetratricopeptide (TPR) repeat protein